MQASQVNDITVLDKTLVEQQLKTKGLPYWDQTYRASGINKTTWWRSLDNPNRLPSSAVLMFLTNLGIDLRKVCR